MLDVNTIIGKEILTDGIYFPTIMSNIKLNAVPITNNLNNFEME